MQRWCASSSPDQSLLFESLTLDSKSVGEQSIELPGLHQPSFVTFVIQVLFGE